MLIFVAAMTLVAQSGEWAAPPPVDGFVVGYQQTAGEQSIEEWVPRGETVQDWSRMVTTLTLGGVSDPARFLAVLESGWKDGCTGATTSPHRIVVKAGVRSFNGRMDCALNPATEKPETMFYRTFVSRGATHMVQVAFRHVPSEAEAQWADGILDGVVLCSATSAHFQCRR